MPQDARASYQFRAWTVLIFAMLVIVPVAALIVPATGGATEETTSAPPTRGWLDIAVDDIEVKLPVREPGSPADALPYGVDSPEDFGLPDKSEVSADGIHRSLSLEDPRARPRTVGLTLLGRGRAPRRRQQGQHRREEDSPHPTGGPSPHR